MDSCAHSVFCLYFHLVIVVKYRRKVFTNEISDFAKSVFANIAVVNYVTLEEWNRSFQKFSTFRGLEQLRAL